MGKVKAKMMEKEDAQAFPTTQATLFEAPVGIGLQNTALPLKNLYVPGGNGQIIGNNYYFHSMGGITTSAASKQETLILNGQAKRNTTTKEKKAKAGQFTNVTNEMVKEKLKKALAEMTAFYEPVPF